jgi:chromosome transmission fidelity protein 8
MDIGQHFLEGSVIKLKTPFLIIEKHKRADGSEEAPNLSVEGYVKTKIIFKTRPKPVGLKRVLK